MDDIDVNDDDWTRSDETFDYNKKIDRLVVLRLSPNLAGYLTERRVKLHFIGSIMGKPIFVISVKIMSFRVNS